MLALVGGRRKQSTCRSPTAYPHSHQAQNGSGRSTTVGMESKGPVGDGVGEGHGGCRVLADADPRAGSLLAGERIKRSDVDSGRRSCRSILERWSGQPTRWRRSTTRCRVPSQECEQTKKGGEEEKSSSRKGRAAEVESERRRKTWRSRQRRKGIRWGRRVLCLEQWQWCLCRAGSGRSMQRKESTPSPVYGVQESGAPEQRLPSEEGWLNFLALLMKGTKVQPAGEGEEAASSSRSRDDRSKGSSSSRGTKVNKFLSEEDEVVDGDRVQIGKKMMEESDYFKVRVFTFVHHFAGERDPLSCALKEEAEKRGVRLRVVAVEKAHGADLFGTGAVQQPSGESCQRWHWWLPFGMAVRYLFETPMEEESRVATTTQIQRPPLWSTGFDGVPNRNKQTMAQFWCAAAWKWGRRWRKDTWGIESQVSILSKTLPAVKFHNTSQLGTCQKPRSLWRRRRGSSLWSSTPAGTNPTSRKPRSTRNPRLLGARYRASWLWGDSATVEKVQYMIRSLERRSRKQQENTQWNCARNMQD